MKYKVTLKFDERPIEMEWFETENLPANIEVSQGVGFCFTRDSQMAIIKKE
jgi:hypothetical protein